MKQHSPKRTLIAAAVASVAALSLAAPAFAQEFDGSKARVNLAGKLRTLTQAVASASCRLDSGIEPEAARSELVEAKNEFNVILAGLTDGSSALGIPSAEKYSVVKKSIGAVRDLWQPVDKAASAMVTGQDSGDGARLIASSNGDLLQATMILASDMTGKYSNPNELTQADAMALNIAGRQLMLAHQMSKEVCGIMANAADMGTVEGLGSTLDTYTVSLNALSNGMVDAGINPPPTEAVAKELAAVNATWTETLGALNAIRGGFAPSSENVANLAVTSADLTTRMDNVVTLYMLATPGQEDVYRVPLRAYAESQLNQWLSNPELIAAIKAQNAEHTNLSQAEIDQLDLDWRAQRKAESKPLIDGILSRPASAWLAQKQSETAQFVTEVFAMDNRGLNVAQSTETSDYWQGDEEKWQDTFGNGSGEMHISEVEFDDSTGSYQSQVSMPVRDPATGEMIGAITFGVNVQSLL